ncbi:MAG: hypothetical protein ACRDUW_03420 [Pseudonocardiaceae bacterium]
MSKHSNEIVIDATPDSDETITLLLQRQSETLDRLKEIEMTVTKIYAVLDQAFTRFEMLSKSPILGSLLGGKK